MNNLLYNDLAQIYNCIAQDRDFEQECKNIIDLYNIENNNSFSKYILELFAGPAYHSSVFNKKYGYNVKCIDSSPEMKKQACLLHSINDEDYVIGNLPQIIDSEYFKKMQHQFDIILIMRYSLGLITYEYANILLQKLASLLKPGGIILIELHKINLLMDYAMSDLKIRNRKKLLANENKVVECIWPSGKLLWDTDSWTVTMPISIMIHDNITGQLQKYETYSREFIYTAADIKYMLSNKSHIKQISSNEFSGIDNFFQQSNLVVFRAEL